MKRLCSERGKVAFIFVILFVVSVISDITMEDNLKSGYINRGTIGEKEKEIELELEIEGLLKDYKYSLEVPSIYPTEKEADKYFQEAISQIEKDFVKVEENVPIKDEYLEGVVEADWSFLPSGIVDTEGNIFVKALKSQETLMQAQATLCCGTYEKIYTFSFVLEKPKLTEEEQMLEEIERQLDNQMSLEGIDVVKLPEEIDGKSIFWSEKREYITPQILLLEIVSVVLLWLFSRKKQEEERKQRILKMEQYYPDLVSYLSLLIGAGMTMRQAWGRLAGHYSWKKETGVMEENEVYEAIVRMNRRLCEGERERLVYQQFTEEIPASCYHKLMRILTGGLEKGTQGIVLQLQEESRMAFEQRILLAKRRGEEASTKMLVPLMLMLMLVMAIVMVPALMEFQV